MQIKLIVDVVVVVVVVVDVGVKIVVVISLLETTSHPLLGGIQCPVGYFLTYASQVCAAPKGIVFALFWSENGYRPCPFWPGIGYGFRGNQERE